VSGSAALPQRAKRTALDDLEAERQAVEGLHIELDRVGSAPTANKTTKRPLLGGGPVCRRGGRLRASVAVLYAADAGGQPLFFLRWVGLGCLFVGHCMANDRRR
jgi:hypothetical protein